MRIKKTLGVIAAATLIMVTGCGNAVDENVEKENTSAQESSVPVEPTESASDEQIEEPAAEADSDYRVVSGGPYGQISLFVPDGWEYIVCPVDDDQMSYGLYGFILKPLEASEGQIELFCSDSFGVCGTGLKQEEMTIAGETAHVGTYDEHEHWDFITFGSDSPQIVAQSIGCDGWTDGMWDEAMTILDSMSFDITKTEGGIGQYISDSDVVRTYEVTDGNRAEELIANNQLSTMVRYYEMADGTWKTDECAYKYRLEITGRMGGAVKDSTFVYLSNIEDISFDQAWKAAGLSSNMDDYFDRKDAVLVAMK